jgi:serine/threonine protein kinase
MSFNVGEMVGPYRITEQLGQGGMATVYKAYHAALDRYVALKVLHPAFNEDPNFLARFQREARLVAKLDHPNIVPIFDYAEHENRPYLVMKFIEGETLKGRLARGPIESNETIRIIEAVGEGLQFAHKRGVLHRDIKPSNVLLSTDGNIYLADFGLARIAQSGESTLTSDMILGTPQYISPEQALGKKDLDEGTDIYSFGVMLYELAVGKVPFTADTPFSIIHDHIYTALPMPRKINPTVSEDIERVLLKALAKDRPDRYKDVRSMVEAFKKAWIVSSTPIPLDEDTIKAHIAAATETPARLPVASLPIGAKTQPPVVAEALTIDTPIPSQRMIPAKNPEIQSGKKKKPWMWIGSGVLLVVCCIIGGLALRYLPATQDSTPTADPSSLLPVSTKTPSAVDLARKQVDQKPEDPYVRLDLVMALLETDQVELANQEFEKALSLGIDNLQFLLDAGDRLVINESWLMAARVFLRAAEIQGVEGITDDLGIKLHESVYKAFILPEARDAISYEAIGNVDRPLMYIARARYSFYNVDQTQGWTALADLDTYKANMPESGLLHGEFYARSNKPREARAALNTLLATQNLNEWIRVEAQNILESLPK